MKKRKMRWMAGILAAGCMMLAGCQKQESAAVQSARTTQAAQETKAAEEEQSSQAAENEKEGQAQSDSAETKEVEELKIAFAPYQDADSIMIAVEPLENLLKEKLADHGYDVKKVTMTVGTSYEAVGEALSAGTADAGFISGGTYTLYDDECEVLLTALRNAINKDSENPADWNDGTLEEETGEMATSYRSILLAGPSEKGQELIAKVNAGEELTWEDLDSANWAVLSPASASGYIYPCLWLQERYGKGIGELSHVVQSDSNTTSLARLASGQADIMVSFGHIRMKNAGKWQSELGGTDEMVKQTGIIGVTAPIFNDTISVSKASAVMDEDFKKAFGESMIEIGETPEGKEIINVFSQKGYTWAKDSDYDEERQAQELLRQLQ